MTTKVYLEKNYRGRFASSLAFQPKMNRVFGNQQTAFLPRGGGSTNEICFALCAIADRGFYKLSVKRI